MSQAGIMVQVLRSPGNGNTGLSIRQRQKVKGNLQLHVCIGLLFFWHLAEILLLMAKDDTQVILAIKIKFLPVVYIGVSWLYFCLSSTHSKLVTNKLFIAPFYFSLRHAISFCLQMNRTVCFYNVGLQSYYQWSSFLDPYGRIVLCIFVGTIYFFIFYLKRKIGASFRRIMWLISAVMLPMAANLLMISGVASNYGLDITPHVLLLTLILFGLEVYNKGFLNLIPVAARHFVEICLTG